MEDVGSDEDEDNKDKTDKKKKKKIKVGLDLTFFGRRSLGGRFAEDRVCSGYIFMVMNTVLLKLAETIERRHCFAEDSRDNTMLIVILGNIRETDSRKTVKSR